VGGYGGDGGGGDGGAIGAATSQWQRITPPVPHKIDVVEPGAWITNLVSTA
jgi:hypothetical protein